MINKRYRDIFEQYVFKGEPTPITIGTLVVFGFSFLLLIVANFSAGRKQAIKYKKRIQKFLLIRQMYFRFINIDQLQEFIERSK